MTKNTNAVETIEETIKETESFRDRITKGLNEFFTLIDSIESISVNPTAIVDAVGRDVITDYTLLPVLMEEGVDKNAVSAAKLPSEMLEARIPGILAYIRGAGKLMDRFADPKKIKEIEAGFKAGFKVTCVTK